MVRTIKNQSILRCVLLCASASLCRMSADLAAETVDHSAFHTILKNTVQDERVDYNAIKQNHLPALNAYLDMLAKVDPAKLDKNEQLAFYINLYNATMIRAITDRLKPGYTPSEKDYGIFKEPLVRTNGKVISLNDLENNAIRPTFKDPRVPGALVSGPRPCRPILPRVFTRGDWDA